MQNRLHLKALKLWLRLCSALLKLCGTLTYDVEVVLGKLWVLLQESAQEGVGVFGCMCIVGLVI